MTKFNFFNSKNIIGLFDTILIIVAFVGSFIFVSSYQNNYSMSAIVVGVEDDKVLIEDDTNNLWEFDGNGFKMNDIVAVTFNTSGTDNNRKDDVVVNVTTLYNYCD